MATQMKRSYFIIERDDVREYRYDGPSELFGSWDEAWAALRERKSARIAELKAELAHLEAKDH